MDPVGIDIAAAAAADDSDRGGVAVCAICIVDESIAPYS